MEYKDDINKKELIEDKVRIIAIAHMDDATLISNSREAVKAQQKRLEICHSFYKMNDIKANPDKYEIIKLIIIRKKQIY